MIRQADFFGKGPGLRTFIHLAARKSRGERAQIVKALLGQTGSQYARVDAAAQEQAERPVRHCAYVDGVIQSGQPVANCRSRPPVAVLVESARSKIETEVVAVLQPGDPAENGARRGNITVGEEGIDGFSRKSAAGRWNEGQNATHDRGKRQLLIMMVVDERLDAHAIANQKNLLPAQVDDGDREHAA